MKIRKRELDLLNDKLASLARIDKTLLPKVIEEASEDAEKLMKERAPYDSGRLQRGITSDVKPNKTTITSQAIDPDSRVDYAPFQEYGTRFQPGKPYFYRTAREVFRKMYNDINDSIRELFSKR